MSQSEGRGSARQGMVGAAILIFLLIHLVIPSEAAVYTVGGAAGWNPNVGNWVRGKKFRAGDVLVFNYDATAHNVVVVDQGSYNGCTTPAGAKVYRSGKDQVKLGKGQSFFICNFPGHCESGMKIAITAA